MKKIFLVLCFGLIACAKDPTGLKLWGTSDSGGGNGANNKVYESYIVNPLNLPAFKEYLQPIMENIQRQEAKYSSGNSALQTINLLTYKTWYIAPIEFETIGKDTLGVSFNKDQTQQLAIQTSKEIWIKADLFNAMSLKDQSDLMVHEFVMNLYFIKYKSISELCRLTAKPQLKEQCRVLEEFDSMLPNQTPQPLNSEDYQNIRRATGFFLSEGKSASRERMREMLAENNFDPRLFAQPIASEEVGKTTFFRSENLIKMFPGERDSNKTLNKCVFVNLKADSSCSLKVSESTVDGSNGSPERRMLLTVQSNDGIEYLSLNTSIESSILMALKDFNPITQSYIYSIQFSKERIKNAQVGDKIRFHTLFAEQTDPRGEESLRISALLSTPMVVSEVLEKNGRRICILDTINPKSIFEDALVVGHSQQDISYIKWANSRMQHAMTCD